ncbi:glycosyltransferase family 4 protein [Candidatus Falkowbacteria bacterium]|nr:glycosyltransferase family 4 protein [Candidatus Falkowbacteria bacterium]
MKKILIFSTAYLPLIGGAEVAVKEITDRAETMQFNMITARLDRKLPKRERIGKIDVYRIGIGWPLFDKYWLAFYGHKFAEKLNKKNKYNLIWAIMASYGGFTAVFFKKRNPAMPFLLTLQEGDDFKYIDRRVGFLKNLFKEIFCRADYIQAISNYLKKWAEEQGATCPIEVVPNGVDIKHFSWEYKAEDLLALKNKLGKLENDKFIITTSRLVLKNAIDDIVKALEYSPDNFKFLILGAGSNENSLKLLAKNLKLDNRIFFLGQISQENLPKYLKISDIFIRPSLSEGLGISFLEAMAVGLPVIATPVGGITDFLRDGETGWFCEVKNPHSIAEKIKYIFDENNRIKVRGVVEKAKKMVEENYGWDLIAAKMRNIFNKITN